MTERMVHKGKRTGADMSMTDDELDKALNFVTDAGSVVRNMARASAFRAAASIARQHRRALAAGDAPQAQRLLAVYNHLRSTFND